MASKKELTSDKRFSRITKDPRFWEMPEKDRKIKIDSRFRAMFHDKKFKLNYTVDKRGRPINRTSTEDLKRFYDLSDSDSDISETDSKQTEKKTNQKKVKSKGGKNSTKSSVGRQTSKQADEVSSVSQLDTLQSDDQKDKSFKPEKDKKGEKATEFPQDLAVAAPKQNSCEVEESSNLQESKSSEESEEEDKLEDNSDLQEESDLGDEGAIREESTSEDDEEDSTNESQTEDDESDESGPDLARGKGNLETSSEDEEENDFLEIFSKDPEVIHEWGEVGKDAPQADQVTRRLAVCNMDWDRLKAKDLLALLNSFTPKGGVIFSVKIYPSEFGKQRMEEEKLKGPAELLSLPQNVTEKDSLYKEKLRDYQFKRLKYFYAVVDCDSPETANKIYEECNGLEFESSYSFVDLRFIPDDVTFDDEPKDVASEVDVTSYKPKYFTSAAVATSKATDASLDSGVQTNISAAAPGPAAPVSLDLANIQAMITAAIQQHLPACLQSQSGNTLPSGQASRSRPFNFAHHHSLDRYSLGSDLGDQEPMINFNGGDYGLSEDEEMPQEQQPSSALFPPALFRSLLFKARSAAGLDSPSTSAAAASSTQIDPLFAGFIPDFIPAPQLFLDNVQRQWRTPALGPQTNSLDRKHFNVAPELASLLSVPLVDTPVLALHTTIPTPGLSEEFLQPEDKRTEQALIKVHQAAAWAIGASSSASFFARCSLIWLRLIKEQIPASNLRAHQDLNKVFAASQFVADASLRASRFASKAMGAAVVARRMHWLRKWPVDTRHKWRLASAPFQGQALFGASLDPIVVETRDKRKILPSQSRRGNFRQSPYSRRPFQAADQGFSFYRPQGQFRSRQRQPQDRSGRGRRPFRGGGGSPPSR